jgi:peptide/nickel transport system permease protein
LIAYIIRRALYVVPLVIGVLLLVFLIFDSGITGDPVYNLLGKGANEQRVKEVREDLGYDRPAAERFFEQVAETVTFDFGRSRQYRTSISEMIVRGAGPSLSVTLPAFLIATMIAVALALFCASFRGGAIDRTLVVVSVAMMSVSSLVYIIFGQYFFAHTLRWFPVGGYEHGIGAIPYVILPIIIFVLLSIAPDLRFFRTAMLEEIKQDYIRTARAKGVSERKVLFVHLLRNAMIPILTRVVVVLPFLFTGSLLIEMFFQIPGLGFMTVSGVMQADLPVIRAMTFISALLYIVANLLTDVLYAVFDPRVRLA